MAVRFRPMEEPYGDDVFQMMKVGLYPYVEQVFGWDDDFQQQRMRDDYRPEWFYWVYVNSERVGFVCFKPYDNALHLHLIVLDQKFQGRGYGQVVMAAIHDLARSESRDVTLTSFKCNTRAVAFYQSLGYDITEDEEHFLLFRLAHKNNRSPILCQAD